MSDEDALRNLLVRADLEHRWQRFEEGLCSASDRAILGSPIVNREEMPMNSAMSLLREACKEYALRSNEGLPVDEAEIRIDACVAAVFTPHFQTPSVDEIELDGPTDSEVTSVRLHLESGFILVVELDP